jgi:hypothetical protein
MNSSAIVAQKCLPPSLRTTVVLIVLTKFKCSLCTPNLPIICRANDLSRLRACLFCHFCPPWFCSTNTPTVTPWCVYLVSYCSSHPFEDSISSYQSRSFIELLGIGLASVQQVVLGILESHLESSSSTLTPSDILEEELNEWIEPDSSSCQSFQFSLSPFPGATSNEFPVSLTYSPDTIILQNIAKTELNGLRQLLKAKSAQLLTKYIHLCSQRTNLSQRLWVPGLSEIPQNEFLHNRQTTAKSCALLSR